MNFAVLCACPDQGLVEPNEECYIVPPQKPSKNFDLASPIEILPHKDNKYIILN